MEKRGWVYGRRDPKSGLTAIVYAMVAYTLLPYLFEMRLIRPRP